MKVRILIIIIMASILCDIECYAQSNMYKIKDNLYEYYKKMDANIQSQKSLKMADTLFVMATREKDVKAQCIALFSKQRHYYIIGDTKSLIKEFKLAAPFIKRTPYLQYYFGMWENNIVAYINDGSFAKATDEITAHRKEAIRLKNDFGIIQSHILQANLYFKQGYYRLALSYYHRAVEYAKSKNVNVDYITNLQLARCCFYLCRWKECKIYLEKTENDPITVNSHITRVYALMLSYDCNQIPLDSTKIEEDYKLLMDTHKKYPILSSDQFMMDEALYYYYKYYKKNIQTAVSYKSHSFHVPAYFDYLKQAIYYESVKDYKQSGYYYDQYIHSLDDEHAKEQQYLIDEFVPQLDVYNLENEKIALRKRNNALQMQELNKNQHILMLTEQQTQGRLLIKQKEHGLLMGQLATQSASIDQQNRLLKLKKLQSEQDKKEVMLAQEKDKWQLSSFLITIAALLFVLAFYTIDKILRQKHLKEEKAKAEKSNYIKSLFFQNMNHEIRTPLNAIAGFNEVLNGEMSNQLSPEEKKELINMIAINNNLLTTLVNDVIDLSDFESGSYKINLTDVNINHICTTVVESIRGRENKDVKLSFRPNHAGDYILHTDAQRLQQVLSNYLTNACKHTESGSIELSYEIVNNMVRFSVTDTGCGVPDEDADKVFERFQMVDHNKRGTGLGLHICMLIAQLLHGKVYLDKTYKKGARFIFDHPIVMALIMMFTLSFSSVKAETGKTLGMHKDVYELYEQAQSVFNPAKGKELANKMYALAIKEKDYIGKCYAMYVQLNYYALENNKAMFMAELKPYKQMCYATGNYDILLSAWVNIITCLISDKDLTTAKQELNEVYEVAKRHSPGYGIGIYNYLAGNFYFIQGQNAAAIFYYLQALDHNIVDYSTVNAMVGQCYMKIGNYNQAIKYCEKAITYKAQEYSLLVPYCILLRCYSKLGRLADAKRIYDSVTKLDLSIHNAQQQKFYHFALYNYYMLINEKAKADEEQKHFDIDDNIYIHDKANYMYGKGLYEEAWKYYKKNAEENTKWLTSDFSDINNFYTGKFNFKEAAQEKELLTLNASNLKLKEKRNSNKLLMLKHDQTIFMLHQNELISREKQNKLNLQRILLQQKKSEYEKQRITEQGLSHQKLMIETNRKWEIFTICITAIFILYGIMLFVRRLRETEKKLFWDATKAKMEERRKSLFYESINRQIHEPLDTIIQLNNKLNDTPGIEISEEERKADIETLNDKTSFITDYINDILLISKLESGTYKAENDICETDVLCTQAIATISSDHEIEYQPVTDSINPLSFTSDGSLVREVIIALLRYAVNRNQDNNRVVLSSVIQSNKLTIKVSYTGYLSKEDKESLFHVGLNTEHEGHEHIGLMKSRLIAELLHGSVSIDNTQEPQIQLIFHIPVNV